MRHATWISSTFALALLTVSITLPSQVRAAPDAPLEATPRAVIEALRLAPDAAARLEIAVRAVTLGREVLVTQVLDAVLVTADRLAIDRLVDAFLARLSTQDHPQFSAIAVSFLRRARTRKAVPLLVHLLTSEEPELRALVARHLGQIGDPIAVFPLARLLRDRPLTDRDRAACADDRLRDLDPRLEAARALGAIGKSWAVRPLVQALDGADGALARAIVASLETLTGASLGAVDGTAALERTTAAWRAWIAHHS